MQNIKMRYPQQLQLQLNKTTDATPEEFEKWREEDFFSKGDFDPLLLFVVIPTIIQLSCVFAMGAVMMLSGYLIG